MASKSTLFNKCAKQSGILKTVGFSNLLLISSNAFVAHLPHINGLPFFVNPYMGFNSFCSYGQDILTKFTMPTKLLQTFWFIGGFNFWIASNLLLGGFTQTLFFLMQMVLPIIKCRFLILLI